MTSARPLILVVDDDEDIRTMLRWALEASGYGVAVASDGVDALEWLGRHGRPAAALVDLMMPRMDGEALVRAIRQTPELVDLPILVLSGHDAAFARVRSGASACVTKPVELDDLLALLGRYAGPPAAPGVEDGPGARRHRRAEPGALAVDRSARRDRSPEAWPRGRRRRS